MKNVIQRVSSARVKVAGKEISSIGRGIVVFSGIRKGDTEQEARQMAAKILNLRVFEDDGGRMNLSIAEAGGSVLSIPQFTLLGRLGGGNRPGFEDASPAAEALPLWKSFNDELSTLGADVREGVFGAHMVIEMTHDGPVTLLLESQAKNSTG